MPPPIARLELARRLLSDQTAAADCAAVHLAYYAAAHHCANRMGRSLTRGEPGEITTHDALCRLVDDAVNTTPDARSDWTMLRPLRALRERADYRPATPPSHLEAELAVANAEAILAVD